MKKQNIIIFIMAIIIVALLSFISFYLWQISDQLNWIYQEILQTGNTIETIRSDVFWIKFH